MAPILKKRKIIDRSTPVITPKASIVSYGRVSKSGLPQQAKKRKLITTKQSLESDLEREDKIVSRDSSIQDSKKRRRDSEDIELASSCIDTQGTSKLGTKTPTTPRKRVRFASDAKDAQTPTKGARKLLESFVISTSQNEPPSKHKLGEAPKKSNGQTKTSTLDNEFQELIDLHAAFLNALSLHYVHNGSGSLVNLRYLIPNIEKRWGKRRITTEDIQRVIGIQQHASNCTIALVEYNKTGICIEMKLAPASVFPVDLFKEHFLNALEKLQSSGDSLPLASIRSSAINEDYQLSKGAQRLREIKAAAIEAQDIPTNFSVPTPQGVELNSKTRATSLLDRIRSKEAHAAALPAPPSQESLARRAALMRLEEIIPILEILSGSSASSITSRNLYSSSASLASLSSLGASLGLGPAPPAKVVSFTMSTVVQYLQNSLKHPISKEEAERSIKLLAIEVMPRWVGVREIGKVIGVTFRGKVNRPEWLGKLKSLLTEQ
jgi:hypothetical protein